MKCYGLCAFITGLDVSGGPDSLDLRSVFRSRRIPPPHLDRHSKVILGNDVPPYLDVGGLPARPLNQGSREGGD